MQVQAPTGDYDKNRLISPGVNHWTFSPTFNATYITDSGFEVSSSFQTDFNTRNPATDYKNGVEYRHEFAVGQHVGPFTLGLGGFYYRQFSDDDAPGLETGNRARVVAAGPADQLLHAWHASGVVSPLQGIRRAQPFRGLHRGVTGGSQFLGRLRDRRAFQLSGTFI